MKKISSNQIAIVAVIVSFISLLMSYDGARLSRKAEFHALKGKALVSLNQTSSNHHMLLLTLFEFADSNISSNDLKFILITRSVLYNNIYELQSMIDEVNEINSPKQMDTIIEIEVSAQQLEIQSKHLLDAFPKSMNITQNQRVEPTVTTPVD